MTTCEKVQVEMGHGFTAMFPIINHYPEPVCTKAFLFCDEAYAAKKVSENALVGGFCFSDPSDEFFRNKEQVHRCLGRDIPETQALVVLVNDVGRNLPVCDLLEDCFFSHWKSASERE